MKDRTVGRLIFAVALLIVVAALVVFAGFMLGLKEIGNERGDRAYQELVE